MTVYDNGDDSSLGLYSKVLRNQRTNDDGGNDDDDDDVRRRTTGSSSYQRWKKD